MKPHSIAKLLVFVGAIFAAISTRADSFDYSYTFSDGTVATGTFAGTLNGNLVSSLSKVTLTVNGTVIISGPFFVESFDNSTQHYVDSGGVVSLDGTQNNFLFANSDAAIGDRSYTGYFGSVGDSIQVYYLGGNVSGLFEPSLNSSWSVTDTSPARVPDAGATLQMLGCALVMLTLFRPRHRIDHRRVLP